MRNGGVAKAFSEWCRGRDLDRGALLLFFISGTLLLLLILAPLTLMQGSHVTVQGTDNPVLEEPTINEIPLPQRIVYIYGDIACHQLPERSIALNGNQFPVCARCMAIYFGIAFGTGLMTLVRIRFSKKRALVGFVPMVIDGGLQALHSLTSYTSTNPLRIVTGFPAGVAIALVGVHIVGEILEDRRRHRLQDAMLARAATDRHQQQYQQ